MPFPMSLSVRRSCRPAFLVFALLALPAARAETAQAAIHVRPYTPLHGLLSDIARAHHVPLETVLADPQAWLRRDSEGSPRRFAPAPPTSRADALLDDPPIQFGLPCPLESLDRPLSGDFDGDGLDDVVALTPATDAVVILSGDTMRPLEFRRDVVLGTGDMLLAVGDVDGDGRTDLIAGRNADSTLAVYRSLGAAGFAVPSRYAVGAPVHFSRTGDLNGDGHLDVVTLQVGGSTAQAVSFLNRGDGSFVIGARAPLPGFLGSAVIADFDGDSREDLAVATVPTPDAPVIRLYRSENDSVLAPWTEMADPGQAAFGALAAADLDGDGHQDLVESRYTLRVHHGLGDGHFTPIAELPVSDYFDSSEPREVLRIADLDQDGWLDIAVAARNGSCYDGACPRVSVVFGSASGVFSAPFQVMALDPNSGRSNPLGLAAGDFNGDGAVDLVTARARSADLRLTLLLNEGLRGLVVPTSLDIAIQPLGIGSVRLRPGQVSRALVWDGSQTWVAGASVPGALTPLAPFSEGEVVSTADLNGDGLEDLVLASADSNAVLLNDGSGGLAAPEFYAGGSHLTCADFDGLNGLDLAVADASGRVLVRLNDGGGGYGSPLDYELVLEDATTSVAGFDLDGDGLAEFLVGHNNGMPRDTLAIHRNLGGSFGPGEPYEIGMLFSHNNEPPWLNTTRPSTIAAGDFNGDGNADLFIVNATVGDNEGSISVLIQGAGHEFSTAVDYRVSRDPWEAVIADLDGDGREDAAVVCDNDWINGVVYVYHSEPDGSLTVMPGTASEGMTTEHYPTSIALGHWNLDGRPDLVVGNLASRSITFFRNTSPRLSVTTTELTLASATRTAGGVSLAWHSAATSLVASVERTFGNDAWSAVASVLSDGYGRIRWVDVNAPADQRMGYRLAWSERGAVRHGGEVWVELPGRGTFSLGLDGARPNPTSSIPTLEFFLPTREDATIEVYDLLGRRVSQQRLADPEPGKRRLSLATGRLAPGLYLARLAQAGRSVTARFIVID